MGLQQTRAKQIRLRLRDPYLTSLEHFAKSAGLDMEDYLIMAGLEFPFTLAKLNQVTPVTEETPNETTGSVPTGTEPAGSEAL